MNQPVIAEVPPSEPAPRFTLSDVLTSMAAREEFLESPDFDAEKFVGTLDPTEDLGKLKLKIESSIAVIEDAEAYAVRMLARANQYSKLARIVMNKSKRLRSYIQFNMTAHGFEQLPGVSRKIVMKRASNPSVTWLRAAGPDDAKNFPDYVKVTPRKYEFIDDPVKKDLKKGAAEGIEFEFAKLEYSYSLEFQDIDQAIIGKKKGKK